MKKLLIGSLIASSVLFANNNVEINVNNDTLEFSSDMYINDRLNTNSSSNYYFTLRYLKTEEENGDDTQSLTTMGLKVINPYTDDNGLSFGLGIKSVYASNDDKTFVATPLTLYGRYELNETIYFDVEASYASKVLSYQDANTYKDGRVTLNYKVLEDGYIFVGARTIETEYYYSDSVTNTIKYDTSAFVGCKVRF